MASVIEDFEFIAKRVAEIRAARYQELGMSAPAAAGDARSPAPASAPAQPYCGGFKYAPGFEHLADEQPD